MFAAKAKSEASDSVTSSAADDGAFDDDATRSASGPASRLQTLHATVNLATL